jgi:hypothetical protein
MSQITARTHVSAIASGAEKGKLRSFLRVVTKNYLRDDWRKAGARRRGGDATILSFEGEDPGRGWGRLPPLRPYRLQLRREIRQCIGADPINPASTPDVKQFTS